MPKVDRETLRKIEVAFERYKAELQESDLKYATVTTYLLDAERFIRWLNDQYEPGEKLRR